MNDEERHFDDKTAPEVTGKLAEDLRTLFRPETSVPPEVDLAVIERAHRRLRRRSPRRLLRWAGPIAAAAVVIFVLVLKFPEKPRSDFVRREVSSPPSFIVTQPDKAEDLDLNTIASLRHYLVRADIDQNGRVDILDAFKLARHIKSTDRPNKKWDINGDGLVDRIDVDSLAFTAVRLDKGVL